MPKSIANIGLEALQDAVHFYLCTLTCNPPVANGEEIGDALGIHFLGQPERPPLNNPGWTTGSVLELLKAAGRVDYVSAPPGKRPGRYYIARNCPSDPSDLKKKWGL